MFGLTPFNRNEVVKHDQNGYLDLFNLMDDFFNDSLPSGRRLRNDTFKIDVREVDEAFVVDAELPGFNKNEIKVEANEDYLSISATKEEAVDESKGKFIHRERRATSVKRSIYLKDMNSDDIKASYKDGLLSLNIPKYVEKNKGKVIDIQ